MSVFQNLLGGVLPPDPSRGCGISWDHCLVYAYFVGTCCLMHRESYCCVRTDDDNVLANTVMPTLLLLAGNLRFFALSSALPLWYINLSLFMSTIKVKVKKKTDLVWDLAHFSLKTWIFLIRGTVSGAFLHIFSHWQRLFLASKQWFWILIVCTSCKTSYNVLSHSRLGRFFLGG